MKQYIDLNCDMGESYGAYTIGGDAGVVPYITSANIACGFHASDPTVMDRTVRLCKENGVQIGAHPGFPDLVGFGRRFMDIAPEDLVNDVIYQVGALKGFLDRYALPLQHVKLHGALYNYLVNEEELLMKVARVLRDSFGNPIFLTLATGNTDKLRERCRREGIRLALEAFPDRAYTDDGELLSRKLPGAVLKDHEEIARRAVAMVVKKGLESVTGRWIDMEIHTLCLHGDNRESIEAAANINRLLREKQLQLAPLSKFLT